MQPACAVGSERGNPVSGDKEDLQEEPVTVRFCSESRLGASWSVKAGMEELTDEEACAFFAADQPFFREESAEGFLMEMEKQKPRTGCVVYEDHPGNPVWFDRSCFEELRQLQGDQGGRKVLKNIRKKRFLSGSGSQRTGGY